MSDLVIFGAQGYALGVCKAIKTVYPDKHISCFLVSKVGGLNPEMLDGIPVRELKAFSEFLADEEKKKIEIIIATPENIQIEIEKLLDDYGFINHSRLTYDKWGELMSPYHTKLGLFKTLNSLKIKEDKTDRFNIDSIHIFMAKFYKDKVLKEKFNLPDYMIPIQVGAELTDIKVADICDNQGENISKKNVNYSEITALYWMWKNVLEKDEDNNIVNDNCCENSYYGLAQYRRMFRLSDEDILRIMNNDVDVVLPYPMPYEPDINVHHNRYLKEGDWNALLTALQELSPEYSKAFKDILKQQFMYNYNVILAKKKVLRDYCAWLFPILERTEELSVPKGSERTDRYIGYMAESLETLYFMYNNDKLKIVHMGCKLFS